MLVLDAGGKQPVPGSPDILAAEIAHAGAHDPTEIVAAAALGGSSHWWGGRCLAFDHVDFLGWPISWNEMLPWWRRAAELVGVEAALRRPAPDKFAQLSQFDATTTETWAPTTILSHRWRRRLIDQNGPAILLHARVVSLSFSDGAIETLDILAAGDRHRVNARRFVLACGGLGTIRLMLLAQRSDPRLFGGAGGPLGRGYMGHLSGSIADLVFEAPQDVQAFNVFRTATCLARRRIIPTAPAVECHPICNTAFWIENPAYGSAAHGSAAASARFLAAFAARIMTGRGMQAGQSVMRPHLANVGRAPWTAAVGLGEALAGLATARLSNQQRPPRGYLSTGGNGWRLVYHAEQKSDPENRISLAQGIDSAGLPKLRIDFRFSEEDTTAVVRAHDLLDRDLRNAGAGWLRWTKGDRQELVMASARDGYHQMGGTVMGVRPGNSVVDRQCRVHGLRNLWIASSSVFPTSGQANPTLTIIALACRIAEQVALASSQPQRRDIRTEMPSRVS